MTKEIKKCVWNFKIPCGGEVKNRLLFDGQLDIPICDLCFNLHEKIVYLHGQSVNIEAIVLLSYSAIEELYDAYKTINSDEYKEKQRKRQEEFCRKNTEKHKDTTGKEDEKI